MTPLPGEFKAYFELLDTSNIQVISDPDDNKFYEFYNADGIWLEIGINLLLALVGHTSYCQSQRAEINGYF